MSEIKSPEFVRDNAIVFVAIYGTLCTSNVYGNSWKGVSLWRSFVLWELACGLIRVATFACRISLSKGSEAASEVLLVLGLHAFIEAISALMDPWMSYTRGDPPSSSRRHRIIATVILCLCDLTSIIGIGINVWNTRNSTDHLSAGNILRLIGGIGFTLVSVTLLATVFYTSAKTKWASRSGLNFTNMSTMILLEAVYRIWSAVGKGWIETDPAIDVWVCLPELVIYPTFWMGIFHENGDVNLWRWWSSRGYYNEERRVSPQSRNSAAAKVQPGV